MSTNTLMLICALVVLVLILAENLITRRIGNRLTEYIFRGQFDKYEELRNKGLTKYLISPFNLIYSDFNKAIVQNNREAAEICLDNFDNMRLSKRQKNTVYARAFYYYVLLKDKEKATRYYRLTKDFSDASAMRDMDIFYDTFVEKGYAYLEEVKELIKTVPQQALSDYESVLSQMYANKGDVLQAEKYKKLAEKHFELLKQAGESKK